jgi:citrate synthase
MTVATDSRSDVAKPSAPNSVPPDFVPGLSGVVAFTTDIAEPDRDGGALRYRGVNVENLVVARVEFGDVWALLVDGKFGDSLPSAEPYELPVHSRDVRVDVQAGWPCSRRRGASGPCSTSTTRPPASS